VFYLLIQFTESRPAQRAGFFIFPPAERKEPPRPRPAEWSIAARIFLPRPPASDLVCRPFVRAFFIFVAPTPAETSPRPPRKSPPDTKKTAPNGRAEKQNSGKLLKEFSAVILFL